MTRTCAALIKNETFLGGILSLIYILKFLSSKARANQFYNCPLTRKKIIKIGFLFLISIYSLIKIACNILPYIHTAPSDFIHLMMLYDYMGEML